MTTAGPPAAESGSSRSAEATFDPSTVPIRPAATVVLLRDSPAGPEVFLLQRVAGMAFASGMSVFPGGAVDAGDSAPGQPWSGPDPGWWGTVLGLSAAVAQATVTAAARELFEEAGVLLTTDGAVPADGEAFRVELDNHRLRWADFLSTLGRSTRSDLLRPWSRWITPVGPRRRYDTYFFVAAIPPDQQADSLTREAVHGQWIRPGDALAHAAAGAITLMTPTRTVLGELAVHPSVAHVLAATVGPTPDATTGPADDIPVGRGRRILAPAAVRRTSGLTSVVLAPNPGPMTLDGTNSYLIASPDRADFVVVDPGPQDLTHLSTLADAGNVTLILITHRHQDHTAGSAWLHERTGAPVRALDPAFCLGGPPLRDGERIAAAGVTLQVMATPGHTSDSVCFLLPDDGPTASEPSGPSTAASGSVLTGDTILGRGTTVLDFPDGRLGSYLASLDRLIALGPALVLPAHGPVLPDLRQVAGYYRTHRTERLDQVRQAVSALSVGGTAPTVDAVTALVYRDVPADVLGAAAKSVEAQLEYLTELGEITR